MSKKKNVSRLLSVLLSFCLLIGLLPVTALAVDEKTDGEMEQKEQMSLAAAASTAADLSKGDAVEGTSYLVTSRKN